MEEGEGAKATALATVRSVQNADRDAAPSPSSPLSAYPMSPGETMPASPCNGPLQSIEASTTTDASNGTDAPYGTDDAEADNSGTRRVDAATPTAIRLETRRAAPQPPSEAPTVADASNGTDASNSTATTGVVAALRSERLPMLHWSHAGADGDGPQEIRHLHRRAGSPTTMAKPESKLRAPRNGGGGEGPLAKISLTAPRTCGHGINSALSLANFSLTKGWVAQDVSA